MHVKNEIIRILKQNSITYSEQTKHSDTYITLHHVDINILHNSSLEVNIFSLDKTNHHPIHSQYFESIKGDDIQKIERFLEAYSQKRMIEYQHPVWDSAVAIEGPKGIFTEPFNDKINVSFECLKGVYEV